MNNDFYNGLPNEVSSNIYWVRRERRINPLSFIPGGSDVVIVYFDGQTLAYDWIKYNEGYIRKVFKVLVEKHWHDQEFDSFEENGYRHSGTTFEGRIKGGRIIRKFIKEIYAKTNPMTGAYSDNPFRCIWQNSDKKHPVIALIDFYSNKTNTTV